MICAKFVSGAWSFARISVFFSCADNFGSADVVFGNNGVYLGNRVSAVIFVQLGLMFKYCQGLFDSSSVPRAFCCENLLFKTVFVMDPGDMLSYSGVPFCCMQCSSCG